MALWTKFVHFRSGLTREKILKKGSMSLEILLKWLPILLLSGNFAMIVRSQFLNPFPDSYCSIEDYSFWGGTLISTGVTQVSGAFECWLLCRSIPDCLVADWVVPGGTKALANANFSGNCYPRQYFIAVKRKRRDWPRCRPWEEKIEGRGDGREGSWTL